MKTTADVVVIGGGIMGASTAYHLARRGCTERRRPRVGRDVRARFDRTQCRRHSLSVRDEGERRAVEGEHRNDGALRRRNGSGSRAPSLRLSVHARPRSRPRAVSRERRVAELARRAEPSRERGGDRRACARGRHRAESSAARGVRSTASSTRMDCCKATCRTRDGSARRC